MRVLVLAFSGWGYDCLKYFITRKQLFKKLTLVTYSYKKEDKKREFWLDIYEYARKNNIEVIEETRPPDYQWFKKDNWDILISSNWRHKIPPYIFDHLSNGAFNIHRSLLPKYKGVSPLKRALKNGDKLVGVSIHKITDCYDEGEVLSQIHYQVSDFESYESVFYGVNKQIPILLDEFFRDFT